MTKLYDPDPLGMGMLATFECVTCGRDRSGDVLSTKEEDVAAAGEGCLQLANVSCSCGESKIRTGWVGGYGFSDEFSDREDEHLTAARPSPAGRASDNYWDTPTEPLPDPLPRTEATARSC